MMHFWYKGHCHGSALRCTGEEIKDWAVAQSATLDEALAYLEEDAEQVYEDMAQGGRTPPFAWEVRWGEAVTVAAGLLLLMIRERDQEEEERAVATAAVPIFGEDGRLERWALEVVEEAISAALERGGNEEWSQVHSQIHAHLYGGGDV